MEDFLNSVPKSLTMKESTDESNDTEIKNVHQKIPVGEYKGKPQSGRIYLLVGFASLCPLASEWLWKRGRNKGAHLSLILLWWDLQQYLHDLCGSHSKSSLYWCPLILRTLPVPDSSSALTHILPASPLV